ncbi:MAG: hypothetical protein ABEJ05_01740 [Haloglomus sp.]
MTQDTPDEDRTEPQTLGEMNHTNPFTGEAFGATQTYDRGCTIAADGGEAGSGPSSERNSDGGEDPEREEVTEHERTGGAGEQPPEELGDVDHTPPGDAEGTNAVYERGHEGREENR